MVTVAIVTPVYATPENQRLGLFRQTVQSVLKQTFPNIVYIVVDDGSTADVDGVLRDFNDSRIRYIKREKQKSELATASNALNYGLDICIQGSGEVFTRRERDNLRAACFLHSDDILSTESVQNRLESLADGFVHTDMGLIGYFGEILGVMRGKPAYESLAAAQKNFVYRHHTIMWDIEFLRHLNNFILKKYDQKGIFDSQVSHSEDRDMSLSSLEAAVEGRNRISYVHSVLVFYRCHHNSITYGNLPDNMRVQRKRVISKHFNGKKEIVREFLMRLNSDPPWSWGMVLPDELKTALKPVRDYSRGIVFRLLHPALAKDLEYQLNAVK